MKSGTPRLRADLELPSHVALSGMTVRGLLNAKTLNSVALQLEGAWGQSPPDDVMRVLTRIRDACLSGVSLLSDGQPDRLRVENRSGCFPAIWLHDDHPSMAWIIVSISPCAWCQLAYQFGHELGHVLCNSWNRASIPRAPCQWIEESLAEAFTIRGLALLAASWQHHPPFGDAAFSHSVMEYRDNLVERYKMEMSGSVSSWFRRHRKSLESRAGDSAAEGPLTLAILRELEANNECVADIGAINRWPERSGVPIEDYLALWKNSCAEIRSPGLLPKQLKRLLGINQVRS